MVVGQKMMMMAAGELSVINELSIDNEDLEADPKSEVNAKSKRELMGSKDLSTLKLAADIKLVDVTLSEGKRDETSRSEISESDGSSARRLSDAQDEINTGQNNRDDKIEAKGKALGARGRQGRRPVPLLTEFLAANEAVDDMSNGGSTEWNHSPSKFNSTKKTTRFSSMRSFTEFADRNDVPTPFMMDGRNSPPLRVSP